MEPILKDAKGKKTIVRSEFYSFGVDRVRRMCDDDAGSLNCRGRFY
jgi:hypothetical protein